MKIPVIKQLVNDYTLEELQKAESQLYEGEELSIEVKGEDEGEQLTHLIAAIWVKEHMAENKSLLKDAVREYTVKVRNSIS